MKTSTKWVHWPTLQAELTPHIEYLEGNVLNAGGGSRQIVLPSASKVTNMDLCAMDGVDIVGDLESIPCPDETFDGILNVAVLEHVRRPWIVVREFHRVLKKGGKLLCVVPFFQPIHYVPEDYFRYTPDGISSLLQDSGFTVEKSIATHSIWHTLGWMGEDIAKERGFFWRMLAFPIAKSIWLISKFSKSSPKTFPNAITVYAKKN